MGILLDPLVGPSSLVMGTVGEVSEVISVSVVGIEMITVGSTLEETVVNVGVGICVGNVAISEVVRFTGKVLDVGWTTVDDIVIDTINSVSLGVDDGRLIVLKQIMVES